MHYCIFFYFFNNNIVKLQYLFLKDMKKIDQFKLLVKNSFRILNKSKLLMTQLSFLVVMGLSIILTIYLSNSLLNQSKNDIVNNGNLANFTITIPNNVRQESISNSGINITIPTESPVDIQLQEKLNDLGLYYTITENVNLSDVQTNSNLIAYRINNNSDVNNVVTQNGNNIPIEKYTSATFAAIEPSIRMLLRLSDGDFNFWKNSYNELKNYFDYNNYTQFYKPWLFVNMLKSGIWNLELSKVKEIYDVLENLSKIPSNIDDFNKNYNIYLNDSELNTNSYWYKWRQLMNITSLAYNGYGYNIACTQTVPLLGEGAGIPFDIQVYDISSYLGIVSNNFYNANNKKSIPSETMHDIMQLPFVNYNTTDSTLNPGSSINVFNPETGRKEPQTSFITWLNSIPDDYKVYVNAIPYVIVGAGTSPDMLYPVLSSTNILVDSKTTGVLYLNQAGYYRSIDGTADDSTIYYSVRYPPDVNTYEQENLFNQLMQYTIENYGYNTVYDLYDQNQPNYVVYLRANFLNNLQNIILIIGVIIGVIIGGLSLFFISTLIRSIIKQNKTTFGIGVANGINKPMLAFSFFPFALIPAIICGILSYVISVLLVNPLNDIISQYWTLIIPSSKYEWWYFFVVVIFLFIMLYVLIICVILWTLRKKTQDILNSSSEFRMNWLIVHSKKLTSLFGAFGSFRLTYMMGNIVRFLVLTFIVTLFSTLISFTVGTYNQFSVAQSYTNRNKNYSFAFDLYSPTINSGYYSPISYQEIGTTQKGIYNYFASSSWYEGTYDTPLTAPIGSFYSGEAYANALKYPYSDNLYFTSLYLPYTDLATQLNNNINFFNNKVFVKAVLDIYLDIGGANINPWEIAKSIMPVSILNLASNLFERQLTINHQFYYWLQEQNKIAINGGHSPILEGVDSPFNGTPIFYSTYLPNVNEQPFTIDGSEITNNYLLANNKDQWMFVQELNYATNKYEWKINQKNAIYPAPTYTVKPKVLQTIVEILTNSQNPLFQYWYKYFYNDNPNLGKPDQEVPELTYKVGYGAVPVNVDDETYTYINGTILNNNKNISAKIIGIKENSNYINLYDSNNNVINNLLFEPIVNSTEVYPIIINEVVQKSYGFNIGDILDVNANNIYDRFNRKNIGIEPFRKVKFKIVGITTSKSGKAYYISQSIANKILGYQDFKKVSITKKWEGPYSPGYGYVPFNGVFTNQTLPNLFYNYGGIYSPSGLTTSKGLWNTNIGDNSGQVDGGEFRNVIVNNWKYLPSLMKINYLVDYSNNNNVINVENDFSNIPMFTNHGDNPYFPGTECVDLNKVGDWVRTLVNVFETDQPVIAEVTSLDSTTIDIGSIFDSTFQNIELIIAVCFVPTLILIITLMAIMIISESSRLVSLMKVLGVSDVKNAFSFMFVYWVVLFLGVLLSVPLTIGGLSLTSLLIFDGFQIIVSPIAPIWIFFVVLAVVGLTFGITCYYGYKKIKKVNVPQAISVR